MEICKSTVFNANFFICSRKGIGPHAYDMTGIHTRRPLGTLRDARSVVLEEDHYCLMYYEHSTAAGLMR